MAAHESISVFEIFKIGVGPSSSHTLGPWRAAQLFLSALEARGALPGDVRQVSVHLYGSLAKTGKGHGTDVAVMLGLAGYDPVTIDTSLITHIMSGIAEKQSIRLKDAVEIPFLKNEHLLFHFKESLPFHPNGMRFEAVTHSGQQYSETYYSIGGGFVSKGEEDTAGPDHRVADHRVTDRNPDPDQKSGMQLPYPVSTAGELLSWCNRTGSEISEVVFSNEIYWRTAPEIKEGLLTIWRTMARCIFDGCQQKTGFLPGGLNVRRRAGIVAERLLCGKTYQDHDAWAVAIRSGGSGFAYTLDWLNCFALAVNEENASFGRVVTAPTNGSAGVIPAVLQYYSIFCDGDRDESVIRFLLTAGEIGSIFKKGATLSAAMGGCQAEIGVSSAMAAAGLTEVMGGSPAQCLMAAEIAMEHHLGMTCDPIAGLVQIPCIERNAMGAIKAITASQLALQGDPGFAKVSLDNAVKTMWETALDMNERYKETSEGGLAVNISVGLSEC